MRKRTVIAVWCAAAVIVRAPDPLSAMAAPSGAATVSPLSAKTPKTISQSVPPRDWKLLESADTLDLFLKEQYTGSMVHSVTVREGGKVIVAETRLSVISGGLSGSAAAAGMEVTEQRMYGLDGALTRARQTISSASGTNEWILSEKPGNGWDLTVVAGGVRRTTPVSSVSENLTATYELFQGIRKRTLKSGDAFTDTVFELTSGKNFSQSVRCVETPRAENGSVWKLITSSEITGHDDRWTIDTCAVTLYQEVWPFTAKKATARDRNGPGRDAPAPPLFEALAIPAPRAASENESIRLTLDSSFAPDTSVRHFYRREGNSWIVSGIARACGKKGPAPDTSPGRFVVATTTMQSDEPRIRRLADSLVKDKRTRCDSIAACNDFVFNRLEKRISPTFSSAIETLDAGFGDCGEHAVLLGALLRSVNIPARVALGLMYDGGRARYLYHAWVVARAQGNWLFADPAFGLFPARRDRIPLVIDDSGDAAAGIIKLIGRIKIDYIKDG